MNTSGAFFETSHFDCDVADHIIPFSFLISDIELKFKFTYLRRVYGRGARNVGVNTFKFTYLHKLRLIFKFERIEIISL